MVNKQVNCPSGEIENELRRYLPRVIIESDQGGDGDVVFRTNQQPDDQFVQSLRHLDKMRSKNRIKSYGVQNSTMDDVFLKISRDTKNGEEKNATSVNLERIGAYFNG